MAQHRWLWSIALSCSLMCAAAETALAQVVISDTAAPIQGRKSGESGSSTASSSDINPNPELTNVKHKEAARDSESPHGNSQRESEERARALGELASDAAKTGVSATHDKGVPPSLDHARDTIEVHNVQRETGNSDAALAAAQKVADKLAEKGVAAVGTAMGLPKDVAETVASGSTAVGRYIRDNTAVGMAVQDAEYNAGVAIDHGMTTAGQRGAKALSGSAFDLSKPLSVPRNEPPPEDLDREAAAKNQRLLSALKGAGLLDTSDGEGSANVTARPASGSRDPSHLGTTSKSSTSGSTAPPHQLDHALEDSGLFGSTAKTGMNKATVEVNTNIRDLLGPGIADPGAGMTSNQRLQADLTQFDQQKAKEAAQARAREAAEKKRREDEAAEAAWMAKYNHDREVALEAERERTEEYLEERREARREARAEQARQQQRAYERLQDSLRAQQAMRELQQYATQSAIAPATTGASGHSSSSCPGSTTCKSDAQ